MAVDGSSPDAGVLFIFAVKVIPTTVMCTAKKFVQVHMSPLGEYQGPLLWGALLALPCERHQLMLTCWPCMQECYVEAIGGGSCSHDVFSPKLHAPPLRSSIQPVDL